MSDQQRLTRESVYRDAKISYLAQGDPSSGISGWHIDFCRAHAGTRILDLGCATGGYCVELKKYGHECVGADVNEEYVKVARSKGLEAHLAGEKLPFDNGSFDTVIMIEVLEHVGDAAQMLDEAKRVAKKNILITVPDCTGYEELKKSRLTYEHFLETDHVNFFTIDSFRALLSKYSGRIEIGRVGPIHPWLYGEPALPLRIPAIILRKTVSLCLTIGLLKPKYFSSLYAIITL